MLHYTTNNQAVNNIFEPARARKYISTFKVSMSAFADLTPCIMIVDDEDVLVEMVASLIEDLGLHAMIAANGKEAIESLLHMPRVPALILSDVMMPQMNGVELAKAVKGDLRLQNVPVILMSAAGQPAGSNAADEFIHKPFDLDLLINLIERYVPGSEQEYGL